MESVSIRRIQCVRYGVLGFSWSGLRGLHLLSFHDAADAKTLWSAIKARFGGNEASKKMQKNLLKQQFETFTIGSREELDSAYERFQNILSMLELYDAKVSHEDANLKFLRSLPSVWHVVATMIRGQPGLDELEFDDLYNNLKVCLKQGAKLLLNVLPTQMNPLFFLCQQASMPTTHDDEDLLQIDEDAMEEIDIRWQVAMITARIRKFMRKTGRPIDLKPKNGITFDKSKIECFNCQKLGHFARECRFAKYQENRANGHKEKKIVAIEDSNSKALVATDNNEEIDWTKEFDAEPVTFAMMALTELEEDDWSMEIDAESVHFGQDGLGDFDWSNKADDTPVSLALMATNSELKTKREEQKKKVSSVKLGRNKDEDNLSEEHHDQDDHNHTAFVYEDFDVIDAVATPDLERKSDETEEVIIEEEKDTSDVKSGDTKELDLEMIQSTARQSAVTPRTLNFNDETGSSKLWRYTDEEVARRFKQNGMQKKREKRLEDLKNKTKGISKKPTISCKGTESNDELLKGKRKANVTDFEKSTQDRESLEAISMITEFKVIDSPDGEYLIIFRANNHFRAFNTLWEILHILDRQDLYHLYLVVQDYYKHILLTGLGLILLGDLTTIWETSATSDDDF
ncbi:ribonuclease H-like domain-containing protein [Tanacetum coccineum]